MPRKNLIRSAELPYHVTARVNNREIFPLEIEKVWNIFTNLCLECTIVYEVQIHAFVLMPNHFHLIITTPKYDLGKVMEHFMKSGTKTINSFSGRSGRIFGGPYHWSLIGSTIYFANALKYVYRNPVRANLCAIVETYRYSTLYGLVGNDRLLFPLFYPFGLGEFLNIPNKTNELVYWLNQQWTCEHEDLIRSGLKKTTFKPPARDWRRLFCDGPV
jgi:putative transposase